VPASLWTSRDGSRTERREWHQFGEPAIIDYMELWEAVCRLASACGWVRRETGRPAGNKQKPSREREGEVVLPISTTEAARQARLYLSAVPPAVEGQGGN